MHALYCLFLIVNLGLYQQAKKTPFKIAITPESQTVVVGSDVWIKVSLINTSNRDLDDSGSWIAGMPLDPNFRFEVRDKEGKVVSTYPRPEMGYSGSPINRTISPHETFTQDQLVSARYDMRKPGKYTIQVSRRISNNPKDDIKSNIVTITVTPKDNDSRKQ